MAANPKHLSLAAIIRWLSYDYSCGENCYKRDTGKYAALGNITADSQVKGVDEWDMAPAQ
jgi:hypothetical protein